MLDEVKVALFVELMRFVASKLYDGVARFHIHITEDTLLVHRLAEPLMDGTSKSSRCLSIKTIVVYWASNNLLTLNDSSLSHN